MKFITLNSLNQMKPKPNIYVCIVFIKLEKIIHLTGYKVLEINTQFKVKKNRKCVIYTSYIFLMNLKSRGCILREYIIRFLNFFKLLTHIN